MARKIIMTGNNAQYIEQRSNDVAADDREIRMEGSHARYEEHAGVARPHYPFFGDAEVGLRQYEFLVRGGYIASTTHEQHFLYLMGYSSQQPEDLKPIEWLTTKEQLHRMLQRRYASLLSQKLLTDAELKKLSPNCFVDKKGNGIEIPKPREEQSLMMDELLKNFPT